MYEVYPDGWGAQTFYSTSGGGHGLNYVQRPRGGMLIKGGQEVTVSEPRQTDSSKPCQETKHLLYIIYLRLCFLAQGGGLNNLQFTITIFQN